MKWPVEMVNLETGETFNTETEITETAEGIKVPAIDLPDGWHRAKMKVGPVVDIVVTRIR